MKKIKIFGISYNLEVETVEALERGRELFEKNDFNSSLNTFSSSQKNNKLKPFIFTLCGHLYHCLKDFELAINEYNKALKFYPANYAALYRMGMVYFSKNDVDNGVKYLKESLQNYPNIDTKYEDYLQNELFNIPKVVIIHNIGNFLGQLKQYDDCFKYIDEAINLFPEYSFAYLTKGLIHILIGNKEKASRYIRKAHELGNTKAYIYLCNIQTDYDELIVKSNYNPLNIVNNKEQNKIHGLPNMTEVFTKELYQICNIEKYTYNREPRMYFFSDILVQYTIFMLVEYSEKAGGFLPVSIVNDMKQQIIHAAQYLVDAYKTEYEIDSFCNRINNKLFEKNCIVEANRIINKYYGK